MSSPLSGLYRLVCEPPGVEVHEVTATEWMGSELVTALRAEGVLVAGQQPETYPCHNWGDNCPRVVHLNAFPGAAKPHWAACRGQQCEHLRVTTEDLRTVSLPAEAFGLWLQRLMKLPKGPVKPDPVLERALVVGVEARGREGRAVLVLMQRATDQLRWYLADIESRYPSALVLIPESHQVSPDLAQAHSASAKVELAYLEDRLTFGAGRPGWMGSTASGRAAAVQTKARPHAVAFTGKRRELDAAQYQEWVGKAGDVDLFIDIAEPKGRRCRAGRKDAKGRYKEVWLPLAEAQLLAHAVVKKRPVRLSEVFNLQHPDMVLTRARALLDVTVSRYQKTYFHPVSGTAGREKEFVFRPPPGATYLVLCRPEFAESFEAAA